MSRIEWRLFFITMLCGLACSAADLKNDILFYEDCNDLESTYPGVKISKSIRVEDNGKFDKCLRIERRTVNTLDNGDFANKSSNDWIYRDNAEWKPVGGCNNSSCLQIDRGEIYIPVIDIKPDYANAFSFYVKKINESSESQLTVSWKSDGQKKVLLRDFSPNNEFKRVTIPLVTKGDSGTIAIKVNGSIIIDNAQLDKGVGFFNSFVPPMGKRLVDKIQIPANGKFFDPAKGAVSCWVNASWFKHKVSSISICGLFTVKNAPTRIKRWGDATVLTLTCIPRKKTSEKPGNFYGLTIDKNNRVASLNEPLDQINISQVKAWHHIVFNWELKDGKMSTSLHIDGKKLARQTPFGPVKKPMLIYIGYCSGAYLNGLLDDFAIFKRPLTDDEVLIIMNSNKPISQL